MKENKSVFQILKAKYPESQYALMEEVRDKAGFNASRSADFIVMSLWPSRGLLLSGIELKSFRNDWLSELKNPKKAENIFQYCDSFWLLTTNDTIAKEEEIPETWGWMYIKGNRIHVKKEAPKLNPAPPTRHFLAAMLKRASDKTNWIAYDSISEKIEDARESGKNHYLYELQQTQERLKNLTQSVQEFQKASGVIISDRWNNNPANIGEIVKLIKDGGTDRIKNNLIHLKQRSEEIHREISRHIQNLTAAPIEDITNA
jgi:hypothetical protein